MSFCIFSLIMVLYFSTKIRNLSFDICHLSKNKLHTLK
uniref:Uncharacterized protein n=1 Tax=Myoviridae sp. ctPoO4 TaxID=2827685 RepID=A0A8S5SMC9_9CAUD|nr:MAG TPA: hypothetical protein [Myoviridae sp. ctPoO4]